VVWRPTLKAMLIRLELNEGNQRRFSGASPLIGTLKQPATGNLGRRLVNTPPQSITSLYQEGETFRWMALIAGQEG